MTYKAFTRSQRETVKALVAEMKELSALWIDVPCTDPAIGTRADWIWRCAMDWDQDGSYQERAQRLAEAEGLEAKAAANRCPDRAPDCSTPSPDAIAQLVAAAKAARFALESACYLQGLRALAPSALQLTEALEAFETVEASAEAHMRAAALSGRPDLAA